MMLWSWGLPSGQPSWRRTRICCTMLFGAAIGAAVVASDAGLLYNAQNSYATSANMTTPRTMFLAQSDVLGEVEATPAVFVVELAAVVELATVVELAAVVELATVVELVASASLQHAVTSPAVAALHGSAAQSLVALAESYTLAPSVPQKSAVFSTVEHTAAAIAPHIVMVQCNASTNTHLITAISQPLS